MGTDAIIMFDADTKTYLNIKLLLDSLDKRTNNSGLGVACTPFTYKFKNKYVVAAQTHWSHENAHIFIREFLKFIKEHGYKIKNIEKIISS